MAETKKPKWWVERNAVLVNAMREALCYVEHMDPEEDVAIEQTRGIYSSESHLAGIIKEILTAALEGREPVWREPTEDEA